MPPLRRGRRALQQGELLPGSGRPAEGGGLERRQPPLEAELPRRDVEQRRHLLGVFTLPALTVEEARVADLPAARVPDTPEHTIPPFRIVLRQPGGEELGERLREAADDPARALGAGAGGGL